VYVCVCVYVWCRVACGRYETRPALLDARSEAAALELGGGPWDEPWEGACEVNALARSILSADVPLERVKDRIPGY
jgi:hypothetical protein